jgi:cytochrome b561
MAMTRTTYSTGAILFHWTIAVLVIANLLIGFGLLKGMPTHKAIGITVLVLSVLRIVWRLIHRQPPLPAIVPGWQATAARISHATFYVLLIAMPLSGWLMVSNAEKLRPLTWFGLFDIPYLTVSRAAGDAGHEIHELLAIPFAALVLLHVAAALKHHFIDRDSVLARMLPMLSR